MPQFLADTVLSRASGEILLSGEESRHIKILRYKKNDRIKVFDLKGNRYEAEITDFREGLVSARLLEKLENPAKKYRLRLYVPFVEKSAFEFVLRHCTEAGADEFVPLRAEYSQGNFAAELTRRRERLEEIILSSVKQCERPDIPSLAEPAGFEEAVSSEEKPVLLHRSGDPGEKNCAPAEIAAAGGVIPLFVGPEAGFSPAEIAFAREKKALFLDLGPHIMRTQTAAVAACAVISALKK